MLSNRAQQSISTEAQSTTKLPIPTTTTPSSPSKNISGLPQHKENNFSPYYRDIHMDTAKGLSSMGGYADIHMGTARGLTINNDITMETARGGTTLKQGGLQIWERELLDSAEVRRKATVAQLCEYPSSICHLWLNVARLSRLLFSNAGIPRVSQGSACQIRQRHHCPRLEGQ
jgi:hypothetical protein